MTTKPDPTADYTAMTQDDFDSHLRWVVEAHCREHGPAGLIFLPGVYEALSEHFHNDVLSDWENANPELAWPDGMPEEDANDD